jgi:hypothetical protein
VPYNNCEFHCVWETALERMSAEVREKNFKEPEMAKYMRAHVFDEGGGRGSPRALALTVWSDA